MWRLDGSVLETFGVASGKNELNSSVEPSIELVALVRKTLVDPFANGDATILEFNGSDCQAVDIQYQVRSTLMSAF